MHVCWVPGLQFAFNRSAAERNANRPLRAMNARARCHDIFDVWIAPLTYANVLTSFNVGVDLLHQQLIDMI